MTHGINTYEYGITQKTYKKLQRNTKVNRAEKHSSNKITVIL